MRRCDRGRSPHQPGATAEGGVAKGELHKYFSDFDTFLAEAIRR
ncbi:hypothetical protein [Kribbella karoonensis]